jgi:glycosyltransferase involved in cell wall biosynthesis
MRTLVVAGEYPWPANSGSRLRLATMLGGLASCGPTDLFAILPLARTDIDPPDGAPGLDRVGHVAFDDGPPTGFGRLVVVASPRTPFELPGHDGGAALRALTRFAHGRYDLVWYFGIRPLVQTEGLLAAPSVLDIVDLEDVKITARAAVPTPKTPSFLAEVRQRAARAFSAEEARRWRRLQQVSGARVAATVVCSELDAVRARAGGIPRVEVVPNAYRVVADPVGRRAVADPPTVVFQGTLRYPPNAEAARFLVRDVAPILRHHVPRVQVRLVGTTTPALVGLDDPPRVTLVGQVPDIADELAGADVVMVPIRFGSGTRLKVLEAFAHRIPVVATTLGAEGLGAEDGVHLLVGDTAEDLAVACARLLRDEDLRGRLVERAHQLFLENYAEGVVATTVSGLARRVVGV